MKTNKFYALCLAILVGMFTASVSAQETPTSVSGGGSGGGNSTKVLPIQSVDALREYALARVDHGSRYVNSTSMDWGWEYSQTQVNVSGKNAEDVLGKLFDAELVYRLNNPDDLIRGYVYLYDKNDNLLFFGYAEYTVADMQKSKPQYNIWMQNIPILSNVSSAEVLALDEDGKTARHYYLEVNQFGELMFQPWMSGSSNGILVVRYNDGSLVTYDLSKPRGEVPGTIGETAAYKIEGHYVYTSDQKGGLPVIKIMELWTRPTALLEITDEQHVTFDVTGVVQMNGTTFFERPTSMIVTQEGKDSGWLIQLNVDQPTEVVLPVGSLRIRSNWTNFGQPGTLYTGPDDSGKG